MTMTDEKNPRVTDNDSGEITVSLDGRELRGWSYANDGERRQKMLLAREYVEGWHDARGGAAGLIKEFEAIGPFDAETLQDLSRSQGHPRSRARSANPMNNNEAIIARIKGVPAQKETPQSKFDPLNPNRPHANDNAPARTP